MNITVNNVPLKQLHTFPGGEVRVQLDLDKIESTIQAGQEGFYIKAKVNTPMHLIALLHTIKIIQEEFGHLMPIPIAVSLPYLPYARQDRVCNEGEINGVKWILSLLSSSGVSSLEVLDVHNKEIVREISRGMDMQIKIHDIDDIIMSNIPLVGNYNFIISPDAGAVEKASRLVESANRIITKDGLAANVNKEVVEMMREMYNIELLSFEKTRDLQTGRIVKFDLSSQSRQILSEIDVKNLTYKRFLVVDDICDGGSTFEYIGQDLLNKFGVIGNIDLFVTHGIFSRGLLHLLRYYDNIITTDSICSIDSNSENRLRIIKL